MIAYGTQPGWAQYRHGLELIMLTRRYEWPLIALVLILCVALLGLIISGKRRAWWLIGLGPILALFAHKFLADPARVFAVYDQPGFVSADQASFLADGDYVLGFGFEGDWYAYPFSTLYARPVVIQTDHDQRLLVMWSAFANRAVVIPIDRSVKAQELEIVSMPANALLVYNARLGQFINGVTGLTIDHRAATGFEVEHAVQTVKTTWKQWRDAHPQAKVMLPPANLPADLPNQPVLPYYPMPATAGAPAKPGTRAALVATTQPAVVLDEDITIRPANLTSDQTYFLLFRDPITGAARAFDRALPGDLFPRFRNKLFPKHPEAVWTDSDSASAWTADGRAVDGPLKGAKLRPIAVDDGVYWDVIRYWYPHLTLTDVPKTQPVDEADSAPTEQSDHAAPAAPRHRPRRRNRAAP